MPKPSKSTILKLDDAVRTYLRVIYQDASHHCHGAKVTRMSADHKIYV